MHICPNQLVEVLGKLILYECEHGGGGHWPGVWQKDQYGNLRQKFDEDQMEDAERSSRTRR